MLHLFSACHLVSNKIEGEKHYSPDKEREVTSQKTYLHKPQGRIEGGVGGGVDSRIRRMFYFCPLWLGISSKLGLNVSLSHYKDKYIIENRKGEQRRAG